MIHAWQVDLEKGIHGNRQKVTLNKSRFWHLDVYMSLKRLDYHDMSLFTVLHPLSLTQNNSILLLLNLIDINYW